MASQNPDNYNSRLTVIILILSVLFEVDYQLKGKLLITGHTIIKMSNTRNYVKTHTGLISWKPNTAA